MNKYRLLVLTDHRTQSKENSIYALVSALLRHPYCDSLDIASRGLPQNDDFFVRRHSAALYVTSVQDAFSYSPQAHAYTRQLHQVDLSHYDVIFLRLPPPADPDFLQFLTEHYPERQMINQPTGMLRTSNKSYLQHFPEITPPVQLVEEAADIQSFSRRFPIVLKPLSNYGGKGIVKIQEQEVDTGGRTIPLETFLRDYRQQPVPYLAMRFLPNVHQGDKRVVVVNERIVGAVLRLPPPGAWLCNASQGGRGVATELTPEEYHIAEVLSPALKAEGVVMYGFDTLVDDSGNRVLSEINTMSIGGLQQMEQLIEQPVVAQTAALLWEYINDEMYGKQT